MMMMMMMIIILHKHIYINYWKKYVRNPLTLHSCHKRNV